MKTIAIFGGGGFIGQKLITFLANNGYHIIVPFQRNTNTAKIRSLGKPGQVIPFKYNLLSESAVEKTLHSSDVIINLKTMWEENNANTYQKTIFDFNVKLIELINKNNKNKLFIFFSGLGVSNTSYSNRIKIIYKVEQHIINNHKNYCIIKPGVVIGRGDPFISKLSNLIKLSPLIPLFGDGHKKFQPVFIDDILEFVKIIIEKKFQKNIFDLAGPEVFSYRNFYLYIFSINNVNKLLISIPFLLSKIFTKILNYFSIKIITYDQLLMFNEDSVIKNKNKSFKDVGMNPKDIRMILNRRREN